MKNKIIILIFLILFIALSGTFVCRYSFSSEKEITKISELISTGKYTQAITILEKKLKDTKSDETKAKYNYLIAVCYRKQGNSGKAIYYYKEAINDKKSDFAVLARFQIAKYYQNLKNYELAEKEYKTIISEYPEFFSIGEAKYQLAECNFKLKNYISAIKNYNDFLESFPEGPRSRMSAFRIGNAYQESGDSQKAYDQYQKIIRRYPETYSARISLDKINELLISFPDLLQEKIIFTMVWSCIRHKDMRMREKSLKKLLVELMI